MADWLNLFLAEVLPYIIVLGACFYAIYWIYAQFMSTQKKQDKDDGKQRRN